MPASLFLHLPPGALGRPDLAGLHVNWRREDGASGASLLGELLAATPTDTGLTLLLSAADVHLAEVEMTRQQARHLKKVLPFLLEESLLDSPDELLFVAGRGQGGRYPVAAVKQAALETLALFFRDAGWRLEGMAVDADLLASHSPCLAPAGEEWLLLHGQQALVLDAASLELFFTQEGVAREQFTEFDRDSVWQPLLAAIGRGQFLDLLQRSWQLQGASQQQASGRWSHWRPTLLVAAVLVLLIWLGAGVQTWRYAAAERHWQAQSAQLFAQLFPQDRATAKLRAQFQSHLASLERGQGGGDFLSLMRVAGPVLAQQKQQGVNPERIQYDLRNGELLLDIDASSYQALQTLRSQLLAAHLKAEISVAKTQAKGVSARIKVEQG